MVSASGSLPRAKKNEVAVTTIRNGAEPLKSTASRVGQPGRDHVFQFHHLLPEFTALENVEMPMRIARTAPAEARQRATDLLTRVGLADRLTHRPSLMSGGEQQRVAVARALVMKPALLLADEPTGDLDETTAESLHDLLREMHAEHGLTSVIATHNPRLASACDRVFRLERGQLHAA